MERLEEHRYRVAQGEQVSVQTEAIGTSSDAEASLDGNPLDSDQVDGRTYFSFTAWKQRGQTHLLDLYLGFTPDALNDAKYKVVLEGGKGTKYIIVVARDPKRAPDRETKHVPVQIDVGGDTGPE